MVSQLLQLRLPHMMRHSLMWDFTTLNPNTGAKDMVLKFGTMLFNTSPPATSDSHVKVVRLKSCIHCMDLKNFILQEFL
jgi:hypothetical protein